MITFPLTLPGEGGPSRCAFHDQNTAGVTVAPFSLAEQIQEFDGQAWLFDLTFPPMNRLVGEAWAGALRSLRGPVGTFYFIPPGYVGRGMVTDPDQGVTVQVVEGGQLGFTLHVKTGLSGPISQGFRAGDFFSLGSGTGIHLHTVVEDVNLSGTGQATMTIWPRLRSAPAADAIVNCTTPRGLFRLITKGVDYEKDEAGNILIAPTTIREAF